ncbi:MAG: hypothetical protein ACMUIU_20055 [bacterium]
MKKRFLCIICVLFFILGFAFVVPAWMGSQSYRIQTSVLSGGGAAMDSASFQMESTLGQPSPLMNSENAPISSNYNLFPGFWYTIDSVLPIMNIPEGWSMISLQVVPPDAKLSTLFPDAVVMYTFKRESGYVRVKENEDLQVGSGYWILVYEDKNYVPIGQPIPYYSTMVYSSGWQMIGGCTSDAKALMDECKIKVIYGFKQESGYIRVQEDENLTPGKGYWILFENVMDQCELTVEIIDP